MKVILINDNPVVGKLVTLSAQKTGDELTQVSSIEEVTGEKYELLIIDDASYIPDLFEQLQNKVSFVRSCYIGSRNTEKPKSFDIELNKPFLPTDLVDIFMETSSIVSTDEDKKDNEFSGEDSGFKGSFEDIDDLDGLGSLDMDNELKDDIAGSQDLQKGLKEDFEDDLLDEIDDFKLSELDLSENDSDSEKIDESINHILDEEDLKEVKNLLEDEDFLDEEDSSESNEDIEKTLLADDTLDEISEALDELDEQLLDEDIKETDTEKTEESLLDEALADFDSIEDDTSAKLEEELGFDEAKDKPEAEENVFDKAIQELEDTTEDNIGLIDEDIEDALDDLDEEEFLNSINEDFNAEKTDDSISHILDEEDAKEVQNLLDVQDSGESNEDTEKAILANDSFDETKEDELEDIETIAEKTEKEDSLLDNELTGLSEMQDDISAEIEEDLSLDETKEDELENIDNVAKPTEEDSLLDNELTGFNEMQDDISAEIEEDLSLDETKEDEDIISAKSIEELIDKELEDATEVDLRLINEEGASQEVDEASLSQIEVSDDELSSININDLKVALGEADKEELALDEVSQTEPENSLETIDISSVNEGIKALEELINTLKQDNVKEALKGMNMTVNISFTENEA